MPRKNRKYVGAAKRKNNIENSPNTKEKTKRDQTFIN
jgi:hypothetical protein